MGNHKPILVLSDRAPNDFTRMCDACAVPYRVMPKGDIARGEAIMLEDFASLALLADVYPAVAPMTPAVAALWDLCVARGKPCYCEYVPLQGVCSARPHRLPYQRLIALPPVSGVARDLPELGLLECHQVQVLAPDTRLAPDLKPILAFGRVAGTQTAIYGLPRTITMGLGQLGSALVATARLAEWQSMEFRPVTFWSRLWANILQHLYPPLPAAARETFLSAHDPRPAFLGRLAAFAPASRREQYLEVLTRGLRWFENAGVLAGARGEGGVYEGFSSAFDARGRKDLRRNYYTRTLAQRADCTADAGIAFAFGARVPGMLPSDAARWQATGANLLGVLFGQWQHWDQTPARGFFGWFNDPFDMGVFYADDNGRCTLEALWHAATSHDPAAIDHAVAAVVALAATHGQNGHRLARLELRGIVRRGGRAWFRADAPTERAYHSPHYEGWSFAALLYGAFLVRDDELVARVAQGLADYIARFPNLPLEHSVNDDFSKLLVAAVMLYQCTKDPQHLAWVRQLVDFFGALQDPATGAIPERDPFQRRDRAEKSNDRYGTGEASVYTSPADTVTDQLYSMPFIALGLDLARKTGQCPQAEGMLQMALDYLCAIQVQSPNPQLHGAWMRGFDYGLGEDGGANGDEGWGAYCIETGWMVGPTLLALALWLADWDPWAPLPPAVADRFARSYGQERHLQARCEARVKVIPPGVALKPPRFQKLRQWRKRRKERRRGE